LSLISQLKTAPNQLTLLRLVFIPLIAVAVVDDHFKWALSLFLIAGISDALDGLLARLLHQKTVLGRYLDPIADKLLLSTMFLVLAFTHKVPWKFTVLIFSRDILFLITCAVLYAAAGLRDFTPSLLGKLNTVAQIITVLLALVDELTQVHWVGVAKLAGLWTVFVLTLFSGIHYTWLVEKRLRRAAGTVSADVEH